MTLCYHCGEPAELELLELFSAHEFLFTACCEGAYDEALDTLNYGSDDEKLAIMRELCVEDYVGAELRRVTDNGAGCLILDYNLVIRPIKRDDARAFIGAHHAHNKPPCGWRYGAAIYNADTLLGVVMCGRPVARALDKNSIVEANRVCVRRDIPDALRWNACSMLYGWAAREAKRRGFARIITYTLETELGISLKAAGWSPTVKTKGGSWNRPSRPRRDSAPTMPKLRWERDFRRAA